MTNWFLNCRKTELEQTKPIIKAAMENALKLDVPLVGQF